MPPKRKRKIKATRPKQTGLYFSYKQPGALKRFITEQGSIIPRGETGLSQKDQRKIAQEIKRARHLALLPFTQTL